MFFQIFQKILELNQGKCRIQFIQVFDEFLSSDVPNLKWGNLFLRMKSDISKKHPNISKSIQRAIAIQLLKK